MKYEIKAELLYKIIEKQKELIYAIKVSDWALADKLDSELTTLNAQLAEQQNTPVKQAFDCAGFFESQLQKDEPRQKDDKEKTILDIFNKIGDDFGYDENNYRKKFTRGNAAKEIAALFEQSQQIGQDLSGDYDVQIKLPKRAGKKYKLLLVEDDPKLTMKALQVKILEELIKYDEYLDEYMDHKRSVKRVEYYLKKWHKHNYLKSKE